MECLAGLWFLRSLKVGRSSLHFRLSDHDYMRDGGQHLGLLGFGGMGRVLLCHAGSGGADEEVTWSAMHDGVGCVIFMTVTRGYACCTT